MSDEELHRLSLLNRARAENRARSRSGVKVVSEKVSEVSSRPVTSESSKSQTLDEMREELDNFVLSDSDDEKEEKVGLRVKEGIFDIPVEEEGVSVSPYNRGKYSVLFEVNIEEREEPEASGKQHRPLQDVMNSVRRNIRAHKQMDYQRGVGSSISILKHDFSEIEIEKIEKIEKI